MSPALQLTLTAIAFGAVGIFSPTRAALVMLLLTNPDTPWPRAISYAAGTTVVFATAVLLGLAGRQVAGGDEAESLVGLVLGLLMIVTAGVMFVRQRRRGDAPSQPSRHPLLTSFGLGAGVAFQSFGRLLLLIAGGYRLGLVGASTVTSLSFAALLLLIWQTPVWGPMLVYVFKRDRFDAMERRARPALDRIEGGPLGAILVGAIGLLLVLEALLRR